MFLNNFFTKKIKLTENKAVLSADKLEAMIRNSATQRGMDPEVAVRVWRSEGGTAYQSNISRDGKGSEGGKEASYGPFQLYTGGGLGNDYEEKYGVDLRDDNTPEGIQRQIDFALNQAIKKGWGPWNGAKEVGIKPRDGLDNAVAKAYIPPDETVAVQALTLPSAVNANQNAIDILQKEFQSAMKRGDGKAMNDILASVKGLGGDTAVQQVAQGTVEPSDARTAQAFTPPEEEKSYAEMGKDALPDSLSVKREELEDAQAKLDALTLNGTQEEVAQAQADVDRIEQAERYNLDVQAGKDVVGGVGTLTKDETDYLKAKQGALMQGKDDVTSIADDDLNRRRAEAYANQQEGMGNTEVADFARAEAKRHEALRNQKLTKGITFGQGSLEQQEQQMKQWDKTKAEGGDPAQSWKGGVITDPDKLKDWQRRNTEADKLQKEKGQWDITKTIDDYIADVSSWGQEVQKAEAEKEPAIPPAQAYSPDTTTTGGAVKQGSGYGQGGVQKPATATAPQAQSYSAPVKSAGGAVKPGSGYGQGGVQTPATPKVDPYPNPGYTGEELRIYNQLSDAQKAKVISDFEKSKKYTDQQRKNITPRTGPTSIPDAKPRSLLDIKHQQTLSKIEGGKVLVDPVQDREISKALTKNYPNVQARNAAIEKLRYTAPSVQDIQKGMTPIVDKSTEYKPDRNANLANNQIGDAYGVLSEPEVPKVEPVKPVTKGSTQTVGKPVPKVEPVKPVTKGSKQTVGKSVPVKETRDFENWVNSVGKV